MVGASSNRVPGATTEAEIRSGPDLWQAVASDAATRADQVCRFLYGRPTIVLGCGSSHLVGRIGSTALRDAGLDAIAVVSSEFVLRPEPRLWLTGAPAALVVSRSGETSESISAVRAFRRRCSGPVIVVTCTPDSTLAADADVVVDLGMAREHAVPQTRSVGAAVVTLLQMAASLKGVDIYDDVVETADVVRQQGADLWRILGDTGAAMQGHILLGSGVGLDIAAEGALKLVEMGRAAAWAHGTLEFRHGPMEALSDTMVVVGPFGDAVAPVERTAARTMVGDTIAYMDPALLLPTASGVSAILGQIYLVHVYALLVSRANGHNADHPARIASYVDDIWLTEPIPSKEKR